MVLMIEAQIMHSISGEQALFWRHVNMNCHAAERGSRHLSLCNVFIAFILPTSCFLCLGSRVCLLLCVVAPASYLSLTEASHIAWQVVCVCTKSTVIHQHTQNVMERGNPAWRERETADSGSICFYGVRRSTLTLCCPTYTWAWPSHTCQVRSSISVTIWSHQGYNSWLFNVQLIWLFI